MADGSRRKRSFIPVGLNLKEFYAVYKGVEFKIYDACPMFTDDRKYQLKCRAGA